MTLPVALLLIVLAGAIVLFWLEKVAADVLGLGVLLVLILARLLPPEDAFAGFGSETVMMILGLFILTAALSRTGVVEIVGRAILRRTGDSPLRLIFAVMLATAGLSAFMSNTAATAFFLPVTIGICRSSKLSPSRILMPMAFASILSSSVTLVSTSTNMVVSGLLSRRGLEPLGMFELTPVGLPIAVIGLLYMFVIGRRLVPDRGASAEPADTFGLRPYLSEAVVRPGSPLAGRSLDASRLGQDLDLTVLRVDRGGRRFTPEPDTLLAEGDVLVVRGHRDNVIKIKDEAGIDFMGDAKLPAPAPNGASHKLAEVILHPRSSLVGSSLAETGFRDRFGLQVLGVNRHGEVVRGKLSRLRLEAGDMLLLEGPTRNLALAEDDGVFLVLGAMEGARPEFKKAPLAAGFFLLSFILAATEVVPIPVAVLLGSLGVFLTRCLTPEEAYRDLDWRVLILIGSMLALGQAMDATGTAAYLASHIVETAGNFGPLWILTGFFALTVFLTQPMSNQAAAVVMIPVALETAFQLGLNPRTFSVMIAVAASCSYLTPLEPSCLLVYGPGRYRFADFVRAGLPLTMIVYAVAIVLVPRLWPL